MPAHVVIREEHVRAVRHGHPWVYRQAVLEKPKSLEMGGVADLCDESRRFVARGIYDPSSSVAVRVWTRDEDERIDEALIARRIAEAVAVRAAAGIPERATAYRLIHGEGDRLPGVIADRWGEWTSVTLQGQALGPWAKRILAAVAAGVPSKGVYLRDDDASRLVSGAAAPAEIGVEEPTGRFLAQIAKPGKPWLFTDMREVRAALAPTFRGRSFLNLFAHTGSFSAAAAAAGAASVVSVDLSKPYLEVAARNVERSAPGYDRHEWIAADAFETLRRLDREGRRFGIALVDPPTFSSSKTTGAFNVKDHYRPLVRAAIRVLEPGGILVAATNWRGVDREDFLRMLHDAAESEAADLRVLAALGQPADHPSVAIVPETRHLEVAICSVPGRSNRR